MVPTFTEDLDGAGLTMAVVVSRFNTLITERLLAGALQAFAEQGVADEKITVVWVPGSFELGYTAQQLGAGAKFDAVLCLGCVIKGETPHNEYINQQAARAIAEASTATGVPAIFGVVTADDLRQALARAGDGPTNKGYECALSAIVMGNLRRRLSELSG